jgi:hypothetical protein
VLISKHEELAAITLVYRGKPTPPWFSDHVLPFCVTSDQNRETPVFELKIVPWLGNVYQWTEWFPTKTEPRLLNVKGVEHI